MKTNKPSDAVEGLKQFCQGPLGEPWVEKLEAIKAAIDALTDKQRNDLFSNYCRHCGTKDLPCYCWNDD